MQRFTWWDLHESSWRGARPLFCCVLIALSMAAVACAGDGSSDAHRQGTARTARPSASSTLPVSATQRCLFTHDSANIAAFAPPVSITLPGGVSTPIVPGPPAGASTGVTLDADGSLDPGEANAAASLLWGSATEDGPFSRLDQAERGDEVTLRQSVGTSTTPADCVQRWRITRIFEPSAVPARTEPALLRLVGFDAEGEDLTVRFYVDAVPAPPQ